MTVHISFIISIPFYVDLFSLFLLLFKTLLKMYCLGLLLSQTLSLKLFKLIKSMMI